MCLEMVWNSQEYFTACSKVLLVCKPQHHGKVRLHSLRFRGLSQDTSGRPTMSQCFYFTFFHIYENYDFLDLFLFFLCFLLFFLFFRTFLLKIMFPYIRKCIYVSRPTKLVLILQYQSESIWRGPPQHTDAF